MRSFLLWSLVASFATAQEGSNLDRFNYRGTEGTDYGPEDWDQVSCSDTENCLGWPDAFEASRGWSLKDNFCRWCPAGSSSCGTHHQSPIDLQRNRAVPGDPDENECIDVHWMAYYDSTCTWDTLKELNAFSVERHALKVVQPITETTSGEWEIACRDDSGKRFGRIDFSKGFSQWWFLSHMDFHVPSEHTQEGKRYDGELHMYHFYSVTGAEAGIDNEMASVAFFLEAYDDIPDYPMLNRLICQWREAEEKTREECGLPSILTEYPGCFFYNRGHTDSAVTTQSISNGQRKLRTTSRNLRPKVKSVHDIILQNHEQMQSNATFKPHKLILSEDDHAEADPDFDWGAFVAEQVAKSTSSQEHRELMNYDHVGPWFNYFPLVDVRTEYYYRYSGSQTVPPCYGRHIGGSRKQTNHWRFMKDPLRVTQRQIDEMHRLLKERIAPLDDPLASCQPDTAAKVNEDDPTKISVARPLMETRDTHYKVFCECIDWPSKWPEDRAWCEQGFMDRLYTHPYNFQTDGF
ncbi:predicted protein [Phaeodactylum tricornutum CCAP 1055/1]|uniref:carbonic anhydrase n=1 Tax=Phaeodactylum tricornutum (strain CCAP 1055/1) TaxID=556484 RepID=B7FUE9_PHATC|nr:predicted protein [Phaeodactylum tricornutum CCAP 1055/1]EEC49975.1 predicted protein [Phaeodactylum tricornutum CCAP 1055/1]|eukprot:XP_002178310.1 predicted protein [Phaeodactylum tricornutum CCAP 1055/1]